MAEVTLSNIKAFVQGNLRLLLDKFGTRAPDFMQLPPYLKEQVAYRQSKCPDCAKVGKCQFCGCKVPGKWFSSEACGSKRWPNIMNEKEWEEFKKTNKDDIHNN